MNHVPIARPVGACATQGRHQRDIVVNQLADVGTQSTTRTADVDNLPGPAETWAPTSPRRSRSATSVRCPVDRTVQLRWNGSSGEPVSDVQGRISRPVTAADAAAAECGGGIGGRMQRPRDHLLACRSYSEHCLRRSSIGTCVEQQTAVEMARLLCHRVDRRRSRRRMRRLRSARASKRVQLPDRPLARRPRSPQGTLRRGRARPSGSDRARLRSRTQPAAAALQSWCRRVQACCRCSSRDGMRGMSVRVDNVTGVSGFITPEQPGGRADVGQPDRRSRRPARRRARSSSRTSACSRPATDIEQKDEKPVEVPDASRCLVTPRGRREAHAGDRSSESRPARSCGTTATKTSSRPPASR